MIFGIDLGTSNSCISYIDETGKPIVVKNLEGNLTTPSVVYYDEDEKEFLVGEIAKDAMKADPDNGIAYIKREMGKGSKFFLGDKEYTPEEISAIILRKLVDNARQVLKQEGKIIDDNEKDKVIVTCPAYFGVSETQATKDAVKLAGLDVIQIINEPTAGAFAYGMISEDTKDKNVMVYDLGGGTFDITIINIHDKAIKTIATTGDHQLGGKNWDQCLATYVCDKFMEEFDKDPREDFDAMNELVADCEKVKKTLSAKAKAPLVFKFDGDRLKLNFDKEMFDEATKSLANRTIDLTDKALEEAKIKVPDLVIDEILLVGGSSKMPQIKEAVEKYGLKTTMYDPDEAVSKGASLYAMTICESREALNQISKDLDITEGEVLDKIKNGETENIDEDKMMLLLASNKVVNVTSRSYGVKSIDPDTKEPRIANIILKNDELPAISSRGFHPSEDNQRFVTIELYESNIMEKDIDMDMGVNIVNVDMDLPAGMKKEDSIEITLKLNEEGLIEVTAVESRNNTTLKTEVTIKKSSDLVS